MKLNLISPFSVRIIAHYYPLSDEFLIGAALLLEENLDLRLVPLPACGRAREEEAPAPGVTGLLGPF
jgi:hypothetical protein